MEGEHEPGAFLLTAGVRVASPLPHHVQHLQPSAAVVLERLLDFYQLVEHPSETHSSESQLWR